MKYLMKSKCFTDIKYSDNLVISSKDINKYVIFIHEEDMLYLGQISEISLICPAYNFVKINIIYEYDYIHFEEDEIDDNRVIDLYEIEILDIFESSELEKAKENYKNFINDIEISKATDKYNL